MAPTVKQLRNFGLTVGGAFVALGVLAQVRHPDGRTQWLLLTVAAPLLILGLARPTLLRQPYRFWMALGAALGVVSTTIILTITYFTVFVLVRVLMSAMRRDPLDLRWMPGRAPTYWRQRDEVNVTDRHLRPF